MISPAAIRRLVLFTSMLAPAVPTTAQVCAFEVAKLLKAGATTPGSFGVGVAVAGTHAAVGSPEPHAGGGSGVVHLFDAGTGQAVATIQANDANSVYSFGDAIAIDGATALIGAPGNTGLGAAYLFDLQTLQQSAKLVSTDLATGDSFGRSVGLSGNVAIVGAPFDDDFGNATGAAYLFDVATGQQTMKLLPSSLAAGDQFGRAVAVDGTTAVATAYGSQILYVFDAVTGQEVAQLTGADTSSNDGFGWSADLSGQTVIVGAWKHSTSGAAYLFDVAVGQQIAKAVPSFGPSGASFGWSVAIDGPLAAVSAVDEVFDGDPLGAVYVIDAASGQHLAKLTASDGQAWDRFGFSVASDASKVLAGAIDADGDFPSSGAAYLYDVGADAPSTYCTAKPNSAGCAAAVLWGGQPSATDTNPFSISAWPVINLKNGLLFYGTTGATAIPLSGGLLCALPPLRRTAIQSSSGSPPPNVDCTGAFYFDFNAVIQTGADPFLVPGQQVNAQFWWRDPAQPDGTGVALTGGIEFTICG